MCKEIEAKIAEIEQKAIPRGWLAKGYSEDAKNRPILQSLSINWAEITDPFEILRKNRPFGLGFE